MAEYPSIGETGWGGKLKSWVEENSVIGVGIRRIVTSFDPDTPLEDGDLLVLLESPTYFTDFSELTTGVAPTGWSQPWATTTWTVEADVDATGGKVLQAVNAASGRHVLAWDDINHIALEVPDVEIVYKYRTSAFDGSVRAVLRGSGDEGAETGYAAGHAASANSIITNRYVAGAYLVMDSEATSGFATNTWWIQRFRIEGSALKVKAWKATDPEPGAWLTESTNAVISAAGFVGLLPFEVATTEYDWVGVAFNGDTAPMEG